MIWIKQNKIFFYFLQYLHYSAIFVFYLYKRMRCVCRILFIYIYIYIYMYIHVYKVMEQFHHNVAITYTVLLGFVPYCFKLVKILKGQKHTYIRLEGQSWNRTSSFIGAQLFLYGRTFLVWMLVLGVAFSSEWVTSILITACPSSIVCKLFL